MSKASKKQSVTLINNKEEGKGAKMESKSSAMIDQWKAGVEASAIAKAMGVRYQFVNNVIHRYCKKNNIEFTTNKVAAESKKSVILKLYNEEHKEIKEIAHILNTNKSYVWQVIDEDRQQR